MRKGLNLLVLSSILMISGVTGAVRAKAAGSTLPFDMQVKLGVSTKTELDTKLKETVVIPENPTGSQDGRQTEEAYLPKSKLFPLEMQVGLGIITKEKLDESLKGKTSGPEFRKEELSEEKLKGQEDAEAGDIAKASSKDEGSDEPAFSRLDYQAYSKVIMVGDSRFAGMEAVSSQPICQWICETGIGYDWLVSNAVPAIDESIEPGCAIVINLGVNDVYRPGTYISFVNAKAEEWMEQGADVYYMSVNPVTDGYGGSVTNADVENFNNLLVSDLSSKIGYIDTCSYLKEHGYGTQDGLHYDADTYAAILDYCLGQLRV